MTTIEALDHAIRSIRYERIVLESRAANYQQYGETLAFERADCRRAAARYEDLRAACVVLDDLKARLMEEANQT